MIHIFHSISRVALLCLSVCAATAAINTITFFNANQSDLISSDPYVYQTAADTDSDQVSGDAEARATGSVVSPFQIHWLSTRKLGVKP